MEEDGPNDGMHEPLGILVGVRKFAERVKAPLELLGRRRLVDERSVDTIKDGNAFLVRALETAGVLRV